MTRQEEIQIAAEEYATGSPNATLRYKAFKDGAEYADKHHVLLKGIVDGVEILINKAIEETVDKQTSNIRYSIHNLYEKERLERYSELKSSIQEEASKITSEVLVNAKEDIQKVLSKIVSDMVRKAISIKK